MRFRVCCVIAAVAVAMLCIAAERQNELPVTIQGWRYGADQTITVQIGNRDEQSLFLNEVSFGRNEWVGVGRDVEGCRTITVTHRVDSEPCAIILKTGQGRFRLALDPQLRR